MKNRIFAAVAVIFFMSACQDSFAPTPVIPREGVLNGGAISPPGNLVATHGKKRSIELSWDEVPGALRYNISKANNPLEAFVQCGETTEPYFNLTVPPGITNYYRVSSVTPNGKVSAQSPYVMGSSLAQPLISDITDITESSAAVTWYMENVSDATYKSDLLYTIYCFNGATEVAQIALDGSQLTENKAVFNGFSANTMYEYQVEAYLKSDQNASEKSDKMDAATARRFRPGAPIDLRASHGAAANEITLSFELPDTVDIALGDNLYDPKPLYFVISKRFYSDSGTNEYYKVCLYFGSISGNVVKPGDASFPGYVPGETVRWTDTSVSRGVKYEYQVQSYVDDTIKLISSDSSKSNAVGWALSEGSLSFGKIEYTINVMGTLYESAKMPLNFKFDPLDESYNYVLIENIEPLNDTHGNDPDVNIERRIPFDTYDAICAYIPEMNFNQKTTETAPGRGVYSYAVEIRLDDDVLDTVKTIGKKEVSEDTEPITVENFSVQDGYTDKFILKWEYRADRKYELFVVNADGSNPVSIGSVNDTPSNDATVMDYSYTYTTGVTPGLTRYFAIKPSRDVGGSFKDGQMVYAGLTSQTLGIPEAELSGEPSYSAITVAWIEAQKADTYRVRYRYTGETDYQTAGILKKEAFSVDAAGKFKYAFKPEGTEIDIAKAGKEIQVQVDALNEGLRKIVGGGEISTTSAEDIKTSLVGPAYLGLSASKADMAQEIEVSWNKVSGAAGYYVFRRQFNMTNTAEEGTESVVYYIPAVEADSINITGKNLLLDSTNAKIDTTTVKAAVVFADGRYRLRDNYMPDSDYTGGIYNRHTDPYKNQQNDMIQGNPYRYWVVPVINGAALASIEFVYGKDGNNKNTDIAYYTIQENSSPITYTGAIAALEKNNGEGFTIGFGRNVIATKGTYKSTPSGNVNDGVKITWSPPPRLAAVAGAANLRYTVYRRESGMSDWDTLKTDVTVPEYIDVQLPNEGRGRAHEYFIGITKAGATVASDPRNSRRFIDLCYTQRDEMNRPFMLGFMLEMVKMESVSRNEQKVGNDFAEEIKWKSAGIKHRDGVGYKWGINGYELWVMNRNIDAEWHLMKEIPYNDILDQLDQNIMVTNSTGLLKVMRDYKHYFKVRSYVLNDDNEKIYCPDPPFTYEYWVGSSTTGYLKNQETDYIKWGARQITTTEFIKIASLYVADGLDRVNGTSWNTGYFGRTANASGNYGTTGSVKADSNFGVTSWDFNFQNFKTDMQVRTGEWQTFITITGTVWAGTGASNQYPQRYGDQGFVSIKGPSDTPTLYTGQIIFGTQGAADLYWDGNPSGGNIRSRVAVIYPSTTARQNIPFKGEDTALPYSGKGDKRFQLDAWR
ncbi:MAG: hypothetical protein LBH20_09435 [Treponema sp.]|jgi:hypothetical protein|nr:hypothetical protein [Treponema sp.]